MPYTTDDYLRSLAYSGLRALYPQTRARLAALAARLGQPPSPVMADLYWSAENTRQTAIRESRRGPRGNPLDIVLRSEVELHMTGRGTWSLSVPGQGLPARCFR